MTPPTVVCLMGPTAAGKTDLAIAMVDAFDMDIVSVDSAMVYRGMDIGTAKPDARTLARAPHRLIDICDPADPYSAGRFRDDALREIAMIQGAGRTPLLVGGTMLYYRALLGGIAELPASQAAVREPLLADLNAQGAPALHQRLAAIDPVAAARIHPNDPQRIVRGLEVHAISGRTLTDWQNDTPPGLGQPVLKIAVMPDDRAVLHERIARRFHQMLKEGLIDEVEALYRRGDLNPDLPSIRAVGYRQVWKYLAGEYDRETLIERGIIATRQLAKRQFTWLRSETDLHRMHNPTLNDIRPLLASQE
ncbi:MAG: tRNA (adenosine(37)-N6)-dimethylallyltransferase MiaA [Gammaproteobacteria bacterium]|nr:tRNA (adenosine(37)-N6)-dimethylallyltransferase MiaA [Gammaproteobacteria bacterium]MCP5137667.1 tRNA (adenosine(37)-N6)-dimethylallyltransferase MiaA [Gammaproteobacteria bacterium]